MIQENYHKIYGMHVLGWGVASAQTLRFHEFGGFEEEKEDQQGEKEGETERESKTRRQGQELHLF